MFYDLNVAYTPNDPELPRTLSFLAELGYSTIALTHTITSKLPSTLPPISTTIPSAPSSVTLLTRLTLTLSDPSQNHRLAALSQTYNLLALRPTNEKTLSLACTSLDCSLISLDLSVRLPYHFKHSTLAAAIQRGVRFEICYAPCILGSSDARRNLITNATALIRATRGRGIVISSEARRALGCRGPWDVVNLAATWGLGQERGREAVGEEARKVVVLARMKRESFRGVVDVVYGGEKRVVEDEKPEGGKGKEKGKQKMAATVSGVKRKADGDVEEDVKAGEEVDGPVSKREMKRRAKRARLEEVNRVVPTLSDAGSGGSTPSKPGQDGVEKPVSKARAKSKADG